MMKKKSLFLMICFFLFCSASGVNAATNLYKNGDFEYGISYPTKMMSGSTGTLKIVKEPVHEGKYALKISGRNGNADFWGQSLKIEKGKTYIFSGHARLSETAANQIIPVNIYWVEGNDKIDILYTEKQPWLYKTCWILPISA